MRLPPGASLAGSWPQGCPPCSQGTGLAALAASEKSRHRPTAPTRLLIGPEAPGPSPRAGGTWRGVALQQPQELHREPGRGDEVVGVVLEVGGGRGDNLGAGTGGEAGAPGWGGQTLPSPGGDGEDLGEPGCRGTGSAHLIPLLCAPDSNSAPQTLATSTSAHITPTRWRCFPTGLAQGWKPLRGRNWVLGPHTRSDPRKAQGRQRWRISERVCDFVSSWQTPTQP